MERRLRRGRRRPVRRLLPSLPSRRTWAPWSRAAAAPRTSRCRPRSAAAPGSTRASSPSGAGWEILGGTSEATPLFAGVVALASQQAGHPLGNIDTALYTLGQQSRTKADAQQTGILDVTTGDNTFGDVTGFKAAPGYDLASGWGTVDAARFVPALARTVNLTP